MHLPEDLEQKWWNILQKGYMINVSGFHYVVYLQVERLWWGTQ